MGREYLTKIALSPKAIYEAEFVAVEDFSGSIMHWINGRGTGWVANKDPKAAVGGDYGLVLITQPSAPYVNDNVYFMKPIGLIPSPKACISALVRIPTNFGYSAACIELQLGDPKSLDALDGWARLNGKDKTAEIRTGGAWVSVGSASFLEENSTYLFELEIDLIKKEYVRVRIGNHTYDASGHTLTTVANYGNEAFIILSVWSLMTDYRGYGYFANVIARCLPS